MIDTGQVRTLAPDALGLVADIGGTHARFGLVSLAGEPRVIEPVTLLCEDYPTAMDAVSAYLSSVGLKRRPAYAVVAVAGPVIAGSITFTNLHWTLSEGGLREDGFRGAKLINDYTALALAASHLEPEQAPTIGGPERGVEGDTLAVIGAGTGFGVSALGKDPEGQAALATEGGHAAFAPVDEVEIEILRILMRRFGRVSIERLLSGPGIVNIHQALGEIEGAAAEAPDPADITRRALEGDKRSAATVDRFCSIYGSAAGDFALTFGAKSGVYLAGGIAPKLLPMLRASPFRERFEAKGRFVDYMRAIPTRVIVRPHAALYGAAWALQRLAAA
jgi:glucokinase